MRKPQSNLRQSGVLVYLVPETKANRFWSEEIARVACSSWTATYLMYIST